MKATCQKKFGVDSPLASFEIRKKGYDKCFLKYGSTGFGIRSDDERRLNAQKANAKMWSKIKSNEKAFNHYLDAQYKTKKYNKSFNISKLENAVYAILLKKYNADNILRQYRDIRYPFSCDFYIKSLDFFIKINGNWTHGKHPFDKNNSQDIEKVNLWLDKAQKSKYYKNAIYTWTNLDVKKQKIAHSNNLNCIFIYSTDICEIERIINEI